MDSLIKITDQVKETIHPVWSTCVGAGRAQEGLRAEWQRQLKQCVDECGFRYIRFHCIFHDDMFVYEELPDGTPVYNWQYVDSLFDALLEMGIRPFVELSTTPGDMRTSDHTCFWFKCWTSPPGDFDKWAELVRKFVLHCRDRYGLEEIRTWYYEVWNEPNLVGFWDGTKTQYFEFYKKTVEAVKSVDSALRVGGPSTSVFVPDERFKGEREDRSLSRISYLTPMDELVFKPVWVEDFLEWMAANDVPVDFVSTHTYPQMFALDMKDEYNPRCRPRDAAESDLRMLRDMVQASAFSDAEIHITEWNSSPQYKDLLHDFPQEATFILMANLEAAQLADSVSYWVFTDIFEERGLVSTIWHGGFGLLNAQGLEKPAYYAYKFLNRLGDSVLKQDKGYMITRHEDGKIAASFYHYPEEVQETIPVCITEKEAFEVLGRGTDRTYELEFPPECAGKTFMLEIVDSQHGWARKTWTEIGSPEPPTREQMQYIRENSYPLRSEIQIDKNGRCSLTLKPWGIASLEEL